MKINKLVIRDFGIINKEELFFDDGLFVFSGNNGEGKSTILKALSLILFNKAPGKLSDYIQWGKNSAFVRCEFIHNSVDYQTTLEISTKGTERWLYSGDTREELTQTSAVTEKLNDILDVKRAIASTTSFEHEIDLISTSPAERREYLKKVYDLSFKRESEKIETDIEKAKNDSLRLKTEIESLKAQEFELYSLQRPPISSSKYEEILKDIEFNKGLLKKFEQSMSALSKQLEDLKEWKKEAEYTENELLSIQEEIKQKQNKIESQKSIISEYESFDFSSIEYEYEKKSSSIKTSIEITKTDIRNAKTAIEERIPRQIKAIQYDESLYKEKSDKLQELKFQIKELDRKGKDLSNGICPVCGTPFDSHNLEEFEKEFQDKNREADALIIELKEIEAKKEEVKKLKESLGNHSKELSSGEAKLEKLQLQLDHLNETKETELSNKKLEIENSIKAANGLISLYQKDVDDRNTVIPKYEEKLEKIKKKVEDSKGVEYQIEILERKLTDIDLILSDLIEIKENYEKVVADNESKKKINEDIEKKKESRDKKVEELQREYENTEKNLDVFKQSLKILTKDFPSFVLSRLIDNLSSFTNEFLQQVYPKYELQFKESKSALSVTYNEGVDVKLASGFEKQVFSFAYKYALGKIQNYNILFLDEVDSAASEENSKLFYETLAKMRDFFGQIFIITHKEDTKDLLANDFNAKVYSLKGGKIERP